MILEELEAAYRDASGEAGEKQVIVSMHLGRGPGKGAQASLGSSPPEPVEFVRHPLIGLKVRELS